MPQVQPPQHETQIPADQIAQLRHLRQWWAQLDTFSQAVHNSLHPTQTAYAIANDGRRLIGCDRFSVILQRGARCRVEAISGQDLVNHRANSVRLLEQLCATALATDEHLRYPCQATNLAPEIEASLEAYVDESQVKSLLLVPLITPHNSLDAEDTPGHFDDPIGALVVEQFSDTAVDEEASRRVEAIVPHSASALNNALDHHRVFLLPLWTALGKTAWVLTARSMPKSATLALFMVALLIILSLVPAKFTLTATGTLEPQRRRNVFAGVDGVVRELFVKEGAVVDKGAILARLRNTELDLKLEKTVGELQTTSTKLAAITASRLTNMARGDREQTYDNQLAAEEEELRQWLKSLQQQHALLLKQKGNLKVRSPIHGEVITWSVRETLAARPVNRGQLLMTVADLNGPWVVELMLPDRRVGHLLTAQERSGSELAVSFILASDPNQQIEGRIKDVAASTKLDEDHGQSVLVTVSFNSEDVEFLRPGAGVTARIHCGRRPLSYVWLHDLFEFVQSKILFRI